MRLPEAREAAPVALAMAASAVLGACTGSQVRHEPVGVSQTHLHGAEDEPLAAVLLAEPGHAHQVEVTIDMPRAVEVEWELACPGYTETGTAGEPWEDYRERRIAELREKRERRVDAAGALGDAILGEAEAEGSVTAPGASAEAEGRVEGRAVAESAADGAIAEPQLGPNDTGARVETETIAFEPAARGQCTLALASASPDQDVGGVVGSIDVEALIDVKEERRARRRAANEAAIEVRGDVGAALVAAGADPELRERQRAAERARAEREARERAEAERRRERAEAAERERRASLALDVRGQITSHLETSRARAERKARERAEAERRRERAEAAERERRLRVAMDVRGELRGRLIAEGGADPHLQERRQRRAEARAEAEAEERRRAEEERRREAAARARARAEAQAEAERELRLRTEAALDARARVAQSLEAAGGVRRPPKPAPPTEARPPEPQGDVVWIEGRYEWTDGQWRWIGGYWAEAASEGGGWSDVVRGGGVEIPGPGVRVEGGVEIEVGAEVEAGAEGEAGGEAEVEVDAGGRR